MTSLVERIDRWLYAGYGKNWDDGLFRERVLARLDERMIVLDLGAGAGIVPEMDFRARAARVCGVDLDPRVERNPMLDEGRVADAGRIPWPDESFDLVFADNVVEHLEDPLLVFSEVRRVLRPGGLFLFKTPNRTHYMPTIARLTPHRFHRFVNRLRGRAEVDTFPTRYRANTAGEVRRLSGLAGLEVWSIERFEGRPEYLRWSWPTYLLGAAYERAVNCSDSLSMFRILIIAALRRPVQGG